MLSLSPMRCKILYVLDLYVFLLWLISSWDKTFVVSDLFTLIYEKAKALGRGAG